MKKIITSRSNQFNIETTKILLCDESPLLLQAVRICLERHLDMEIIAETISSEEAVTLSKRLHPDIVIIELDMPGLSGLDATKQIIEANPSTKVVILSFFRDDRIPVLDIINSGASGYFTKYSPGEALVHTVRAIIAGKQVFSQPGSPKVVTDNEPATMVSFHKLTEKELLIIKMIGQGLSNKEICNKLNISLPNVKVTLTIIFRKLGVSSRTEAVSYCLKAGITTFNDLNQSPIV